MADQTSAERRSLIMARIKGKNTGPEMRTRKAVHAMGLRFRPHLADLPGKPDLVFPSRRVALFAHGCFRPTFRWRSMPCTVVPET